MSLSRTNRWIHHWATLIVAIPVMIMITTGVLLLLKKDIEWIQPSSEKGTGRAPVVGFETVLSAVQAVPQAEISGWEDIDRLDVRPSKGMMKIRAENRWEIQLDATTAEVLKVAYRRSDLIESIHDGSFFHKHAKLWIFLPAAIVLAVMWATGLYLFALPHIARARKRRKSGGRRIQGAAKA